MYKLFLLIISSSVLLFSEIHSVEGARFQQSKEAVATATYGHIDARGLKNILDAGTPLTLLDARGRNWHVNSKIPGAELASYEYSQEELETLIPNKDELIIIYCFSFNCPFSRKLADLLTALDYKYVIEYPGGLEEWRDVANYPTVAIIDFQ